MDVARNEYDRFDEANASTSTASTVSTVINEQNDVEQGRGDDLPPNQGVQGQGQVNPAVNAPLVDVDLRDDDAGGSGDADGSGDAGGNQGDDGLLDYAGLPPSPATPSPGNGRQGAGTGTSSDLSIGARTRRSASITSGIPRPRPRADPGIPPPASATRRNPARASTVTKANPKSRN